MGWLNALPLAKQLHGYTSGDARADLTAGWTTAIMLIPQAMAYAMLAGLEPIVGLYASVVPLLVYAVFGTSRQLAVGPVAMDSLLVASGVGALAAQGSPDYLQMAVLLALMVGVLHLVMGLFRLGKAMDWLAHPAVAGFTSAAALIISSSQLSHILGISLPRGEPVHHIVRTAVGHIAQWHLPTLLVAVAAMTTLVVLKAKAPRVPRFLLVVGASTAAVWGLGLHEMGVAIVGEVPAGLPGFALPTVASQQVVALLPTALTIALVAFMEAGAVAKAMARKHGTRLQPNQELKALGLANLAGSFFGAYPVTGGLSRTAVNDQAGARTALASVVTALTVAATLVWFTPLFYFLPKAVLAAIIFTAVLGLVDVAEARHLWHHHRPGLALMALSFVATLFVGIEAGIGAGFLGSLLLRALGKHQDTVPAGPATSTP